MNSMYNLCRDYFLLVCTH